MAKGKRLTTEEFIKRAKEVHGDKYDYSKVKYTNKHTKVCIICPIHGEFWQEPNSHLYGCGCNECWLTKNLTSKLSNTEKFIKKARKVHGNKYDYSKVEYKHSLKKICIICPTHGEFWMKPNDHLNGQGCKMCNESRLEKKIRLLLEQNKIDFIPQYRIEWLGKKSLDFFLPYYNIAIECQGIQHFKELKHFGGAKSFNKNKENDLLKLEQCTHHGIRIMYYTEKRLLRDLEDNKMYNDNIYFDENEILKNIKISKNI